jgi:hypothetical protein
MMNERIRELAEQAGGHPNYKAFRGYFLPPPPNYIDPATVDLEKFAELIVKECAWTVRMTEFGQKITQEQIARHIEDHFFGVEE